MTWQLTLRELEGSRERTVLRGFQFDTLWWLSWGLLVWRESMQNIPTNFLQIASLYFAEVTWPIVNCVKTKSCFLWHTLFPKNFLHGKIFSIKFSWKFHGFLGNSCKSPSSTSRHVWKVRIGQCECSSGCAQWLTSLSRQELIEHVLGGDKQKRIGSCSYESGGSAGADKLKHDISFSKKKKKDFVFYFTTNLWLWFIHLLLFKVKCQYSR